jgi:pimeloyl-ACP methyl ester carboxylesterase
MRRRRLGDGVEGKFGSGDRDHGGAEAARQVREPESSRCSAGVGSPHGFSSKPFLEDFETIPRFVDHILDFIDAAGVEKAHVEGESLGGWIAMRLALWHPDRINRLILNTTAGWPIDGKPSLPPGWPSGR